MSNTFRINDLTFRYARELPENAWQNERSVEVALARDFVRRSGAGLIEVGNVLSQYDQISHKIESVTSCAPLTIAGHSVLSISSLLSSAEPISLLSDIVGRAASYLITFPIGFNAQLDAHVKAHSEIPRLTMKRTNWKNEWIQHLDSNDFSFPFGHSDKPIPHGFFNNANGVCIVTNVPELLPPANPHYAFFKQNEAARDKVFHEICEQFGGKPVSILEIGAARDTRAESRFGDGWSTMFWSEYILVHGGSIKVVDVDPYSISCCKTLTSYFKDKIDIQYVLDDGYNHINGDYTLVYLDGSDDPNEMLKQFEAIKAGTLVLSDDAHTKGTALRAKYMNYRLFKCGPNGQHEMTLHVR